MRMTIASRNRVMTGTPGRPLSSELSEQLLSVAVDILAEEGWGRLNSDRVAARARAGKAGIYRRWPTMAALARHARWAGSASSPPPADAGSLRRRPRRAGRPLDAARWTARSGPSPASSAPPGTRRSCGPASTPPWSRRSPPRSSEIGRAGRGPRRAGRAGPARAAGLGARGVLVAAVHRGRRRRDDRRAGGVGRRRRPAAAGRAPTSVRGLSAAAASL